MTPATTVAPTVDGDALLAAIPEHMRPTEVLETLKPKLLVPAVEKRGVAVFSEIVTVQPGEDVTFCTHLPGVVSETLYIHDTEGVQSNYGHHAILQFSANPIAPGTQRCDPQSLEVQSQGLVLGGTGGEGNTNLKLPSNVVSEIPVGSQLIINHHWINTGDQPARAQAEMITIPPDSTENLIIARALGVTTFNFLLPPKQASERSVTCMFDHDVQILAMTGHAHSLATNVKAERLGARAEIMFDNAWDESMISHPKNRSFPLEAPYTIKAGEGVTVTCQWNNTLGNTVSFPQEMCALFAWQIGSPKDSVCVDSAWL